MRRFLLKISLFLTIGLVLGEGIIRTFHLSIDVPEAYTADDHLIKFKPNQTGNYINSSHKWVISKYGNFGYEPPSLDKLVTVIGDSYISNIMNPPRCHQANYLAKSNLPFNFYPSSRDGASFIEFMEMKKSLGNLNPLLHLMYVRDWDFIESVVELGRKPLTVQYSLTSDELKYAEMTAGPVKSFLYNFKFPYYLYRKLLATAFTDTENDPTQSEEQEKLQTIDYTAIKTLLIHTRGNYKIDNVILVFSPDSDPHLIELVEKTGFKTIRLKSDNYDLWRLENDRHWSCLGHQQAAEQVSTYLGTGKFTTHLEGVTH